MPAGLPGFQKLSGWYGDRRMNFSIRALLAFLCAGAVAPASLAVDFNRDIRPILSDKCFACHGPDAKARKGGLRLDAREDALAVIDLESPAESELLRRVRSQNADDVMPPVETHKPVTAAEADLLERWLTEGAGYLGHWSFLPIQRPEIPASSPEGTRSSIDAFVLRRLKLAGARPAPLAGRRTLIRRVTLDLTGLPPTPDEVEAFLNDPQPDGAAYERVVERLLRSPRYGEHMAVQWLDAARYADSDGYESDPLRTMWPWRDWVVKAFNDNLPYDQFVIEQLAGDLLEKPTLLQLLATGFNRNHRLNNEGGILPEEWLVEYICDRAETTATVFLGLTWGCARCHDHKYDPVTQADYYSLFAYFHNVPESGRAVGSRDAHPMMEVSRLQDIERLESLNARYEPLKKRLDQAGKGGEFASAYQEWEKGIDAAALKKLPRNLSKTAAVKWNAAQKKEARAYFLNNRYAGSAELRKKMRPLERELAALKRSGAKVMIMAELETPRDTFILNRGVYNQPTAKVAMATPASLPPMAADLPNNRLGLAKWLVSSENPLAARVAVNRFWERYFGVGLVKTQEDFGSQGEPPSHPELLDHLAAEFMASGWDVKALQKRIVTSGTYRQSSRGAPESYAADPENRLLSRGPRLRLAANVIRDQALFVAGLMVDKVGGPPVKPYQPEGLWKEIIKGRVEYRRDSGEKLYRRSLYTLWRRAVKPPLMMLLDSNERDTCNVNQKRTNTPLQALLLLNDVTFVEAARGLAGRMIHEGGATASDRIDFGMRLCVGRPAKEEEREILGGELAASLRGFTKDPEAAAALVAGGESGAPAGVGAVELAAYTALARALLNLDETMTKQ